MSSRSSQTKPKCRCPVPGHGTDCILSEEIRSEWSKKRLRRWGRRQARKLVEEGAQDVSKAALEDS